MSLLRLSPEAARLRRIAKACQAGELSRAEYRRARRTLIDDFANHRSSVARAAWVETTVPRFALEETLRREALDGPRHYRRMDAPRSQRLMLLLILLAVLAAVLWPPAG